MALPTESELTGIGVTNAQMKIALAGQRNFIANTIGTTETAAGARTALGSGTVGDALFIAETAAEAHAAMPLQSATAVTASGTSVEFTSIPSWVKRITINYAGVSTSGASDLIVQLGDSGGYETSGYNGAASRTSSTVVTANHSSGFLHTYAWDGAFVLHGSVVLTLTDASANTWAYTFNGSISNLASTFVASGTKSLSAALDRIRITTAGGSQTFDAGTVNILYE